MRANLMPRWTASRAKCVALLIASWTDGPKLRVDLLRAEHCMHLRGFRGKLFIAAFAPDRKTFVGWGTGMDAMTLYMVVRMASGEARVVLKTPLRGQTCDEAKLDTGAYMLMQKQYAAGAKLVILFCTGAAPHDFAGPVHDRAVRDGSGAVSWALVS
jgi:hypothetical protein